jgi:hypothetical protein
MVVFFEGLAEAYKVLKTESLTFCKRVFLLILGLNLSFMTNLVYAATGEDGSSSVTKLQYSFPTKKNATEYFLETSYESFSSLRSSEAPGVSPVLLKAQFKTKKTKYYFLNSKIEIAPNVSSKPYLIIKDAYVRLPVTTKSSLSFGFKDIVWNEIDHQWGLGIWQPQVRRDYLNPEQTGLPGIYFTKNMDLKRKHKIKTTLFFSGLFFPDQGPHYEEVNGKIRSNNPWFSEPGDYIGIQETPTEIFYKINEPEVSEIIKQHSFALKAKYIYDKYFWINMAYANKPMNQLGILMTHHLNALVGDMHTSVNIRPEVIRHSVASIDFGFIEKQSKIWLSMNYDSPFVNENLNSGTERSELSQSYFAAVFLSHNLIKTPYEFHGGILVSDVNVLNKNKDSILENVEDSLARFDYDEFTTLGFKKKTIDTQISYGFDYFYSIKKQGGFFKSNIVYHYSRKLHFNAGIKIIGSMQENNSFYSKYRENDSLVVGVKYVF